jgi:SAM-dependent methyltransferase
MSQPAATRIKSALRHIPGFRAARFLRSLFGDTETRHAALLLLHPPSGLYQPWGATSFNRYPELFAFVRAALADGPAVRILSFGCSTGEEVFSLRGYFPQARIHGLDINPWNIALCRLRRWRQGATRTSFAAAASTAAQPPAAYDAIFAMAVFRHGALNTVPPPPACDAKICFADFDRSIADLARVLKPGGLLVVQNAMFRFADTGSAAAFEVVHSVKLPAPVPLYDRSNRLIPSADYEDVIFRKIR